MYQFFLDAQEAAELDSPEKETQFEEKMKALRKVEMKKRENRWKSIEYDKLASWSYLMSSMAAYDYACLFHILKEIKLRNPEFQPKTLLDFGSGVGTVTW